VNTLCKIRVQYLIGITWGIYAIYLVLIQDLFLFPKDSLEVILPAIMQTLIVMVFTRLLKEKYLTTISLSALSCCLLVILWHFNLNHGIPRKQIVMLFLVLPMLMTAITYLVGKIKKAIPVSLLNSFGVSLLVTFVNFLIAVFTFYIIHYWI
jgi:hypothetical protein